MAEVIVLSREQYQADIMEAAKIGAIEAIKKYKPEDEWLSFHEAKAHLHIKDDAAFRRWRNDNRFIGSEKVKTIAGKKFFNKKYM